VFERQELSNWKIITSRLTWIRTQIAHVDVLNNLLCASKSKTEMRGPMNTSEWVSSWPFFLPAGIISFSPWKSARSMNTAFSKEWGQWLHSTTKTNALWSGTSKAAFFSTCAIDTHSQSFRCTRLLGYHTVPTNAPNWLSSRALSSGAPLAIFASRSGTRGCEMFLPA